MATWVMLIVSSSIYSLVVLVVFFMRSRATKADISKLFHFRNREDISLIFLEKEVGRRRYRKLMAEAEGGSRDFFEKN